MNDDSLLLFETRLAAALRAADPVAALRELGKDPSLPPEFGLSHALANENGFKLAALLVAKLRFSRLMQGSTIAGNWFDIEPTTFTREFKRYHAEVPPLDFFPQGEGATFDTYKCESQDVDKP